jgi:regulator of sigma E protease
MSYFIGLLLTLPLLIVVHEYGHYRVAVACGVKVLRFSVGFGPVLWRRQATAESTEFVICAIPLGGYVRMLDERDADVTEKDLSGAHNRKSVSARAAIAAAGPLANLLLAVLLFAGAYWVGMQEAKAVLGPALPGSLAERAGMRAGDWVRAVSDDGSSWREVQSMNDLYWQLTQAAVQGQAVQMQVSDREGRSTRTVTLELGRLEARDVDGNLASKVGLGAPFREPVLGEIKAGGPAEQSGLKQGDRVLSIGGEAIPDAQTLHGRIRASVVVGAALAQVWVVERGGRSMELTVTPRMEGTGSKAYGRIEAFIGAPPQAVTVHYGPVDGVVRGLRRTWETSVFTLRMLGRMLIGEASLKNLSGPISIADFAGQAVQQGPSRILEFMALVSVSLGVLNLLPLPMLDGGHLMYYIFEALTGKPVSDAWLARLQRGGIAVLLMMMSVALFNDVTRLLGL